MTGAPAAGGAVQAAPRLFHALVDDAGLFPPEKLPMDAAVTRHRSDESAAHPVLTQRFLCPATALDDLRERLRPDERWRIGLIVDVGLDELAAVLATVDGDERLVLETVELRLPPGDPRAAVEQVVATVGSRGAAVCVELSPAVAGWENALAAVAERGLTAKVRCGGIEAHLFPTAAQLAAFLTAAVRTGVPFRATAGLHHAVRYRDPRTGFDHHGFLNILVATARAVEGADEPDVRADVEAALLVDDGAQLAAQARDLPATTADLARQRFLAYGSCSTSEPVADLAELGLVGKDN
jgi:hypothetical protein